MICLFIVIDLPVGDGSIHHDPSLIVSSLISTASVRPRDVPLHQKPWTPAGGQQADVGSGQVFGTQVKAAV